MTTLLAIALATQTEHGAPQLTFCWPPNPRPIPRLDRPVYKPQQARAGAPFSAKEPSPESPKYVRKFASSESQRNTANEGSKRYSDEFDTEVEEDATGMRYIRGHRALRGSSSEEDSPRLVPADVEGPPYPRGRPGPGRQTTTPLRSLSGATPHIAPGDEDDTSALPQNFYRARASTGSVPRPDDAGHRSSPNFLGFPPETWAEMITPRSGHGRKLELVIDALAVVGHPVHLKKMEGHDGKTGKERGRSRTRSGDKKTSEGNEEPVNIHPVLKMSPTVASPQFRASKFTIRTPTTISQLTRMMSPATTEDGSRLSAPPSMAGSIHSASPTPSPRVTPKPLSESNVGSPPGPHLPFDYSPLDPQPQTTGNALSPTTDNLPFHRLTSFTFVLFIDTPPAAHLSHHLDVYYRDVVLKLTAALKRLERSSNYLSREAEICNSIEMTPNGRWSDVVTMRERSSGLARELAVLFEELVERGEASASLDGGMVLDLLLHRELFDDTGSEEQNENLSSSWNERAFSPVLPGGEEDDWAHLQAWRTLLPLWESTEKLLEGIPSGSLLAEFVSMLTPTLTLAEYQTLLDADAAAIAEMAEHLLYWRKVRLIDVVSLKHWYQLTPQHHPDRLDLPGLSADFAHSFPDLPPLLMIMANVSNQSRSFSTVVPGMDSRHGPDKTDALAALVWLLRHELVSRVRTFVRVRITADIKRQARRKARLRSTKTSEGDENSIRGSDSISASPEVHSRPFAFMDEPARDPSVEIRFSPAPNPVEIAAESSSSGFSLHPHHYPSGNTTSRSSSYTNLNTSAGRHGSPGTSPSQSTALALAARRQRQRMRQQSVQSVRSEASEMTTGSEDQDMSEVLEASVVADPGRASAVERTWSEELSVDKGGTVKRNFNAALRYFNGKYPIEEIASRSGLTRRNLKEVLKAYESSLVLLMHQ